MNGRLQGGFKGPRKQGGFITEAIGIASLVLGGYSALQGGKAARAAGRAADASSAYYDTLADISAEQWDEWKTKGRPYLEEMAGMRKSDIAEEMGIAADQVRSQYALARERAQRSLGYARNPGDPGWGQVLQSTYGAEASDVAGAMTGARRGALDRDYARLTDVVNIYKGFPAQAMEGYRASGAGQLGVAGQQRGIADMYGRYGAQAAYGAGRILEPWLRPGTTPETSGITAEPTAVTNPDWAPGEMAEGGKINGPGTGVSDSIKAIKRPGTYILSADTVRAVGTKKLTDMMDRAGVRPGQGGESEAGGVPVKVSNGEWAMPPEVTSYYGEDFFNKLQQKYHRPVFAEGEANGGAIRRRVLPRNVEDAIFRAMPDEALRRRH